MRQQREAYLPLLEALGYTGAPGARLGDDGVSIPLLSEIIRSDGKPDLWVLEAVGASSEAADPLGLNPLPEQLPPDADAGPISPDNWEEIITRHVFGANEPPRWVLLCGPASILLLDRTKWHQKRLLRFNLSDIFGRMESSTLRAAAALLHRDSICAEDGMSRLDTLDENSHRHAFAVSADLKYSAREAVEIIGNEAVWYLREVLHEKVYGKDLAEQLTRECLRYLYRLLFLFYVEAREELLYAPIKSEEYRSGYSLEHLRAVAEQPMTTDEALDGFYMHESLQLLFRLVFEGCQHGLSSVTYQHTFQMEPLRSDLFDPTETPLLNRVRLRNRALQRVIELLSLSRPGRGRRGRISYAQLGINQLGSVYEGLLSYRGFFAEEDLYEVQSAGDEYDPLAQAFFVPASELANYKEEERSKDEHGRLRKHLKATFIYRLAGRDRQKSCAEHVQQLGSESLLPNLMEVKG